MNATPPPPISLAPDVPFKFVAGDPSLELVNTVDWTDRGLENDQLSDYERLTRWAEGAGVLEPATGDELRRRAEEDPGAAGEALLEARRMRWILRRAFRSLVGPEHQAELADFNDLLAQVSARLVVEQDPLSPHCCKVSWRGADQRLESPLWPVVRAAEQLLVSPEAARIRECGGTACGWMYVDRSRNGLRRWCEMKVCGTRAKSRRRTARRRALRRAS